jgi:pimeloyl-ACP methyl ester carboxylesterase
LAADLGGLHRALPGLATRTLLIVGGDDKAILPDTAFALAEGPGFRKQNLGHALRRLLVGEMAEPADQGHAGRLHRALPGLATRTLLIVGGDDKAILPDTAFALREAAPVPAPQGRPRVRASESRTSATRSGASSWARWRTLLIVGGDDKAILPDTAFALRDRLPDARVALIPPRSQFAIMPSAPRTWPDRAKSRR